MMILLSILLLLGIFGLVYLKGKSLQMVFNGVTEVLREKRKKRDSVSHLAGSNISAIEVYDGQKFHIRVCDAKEIEAFKRSLEKTKVCKLNRKNRSDGPRIEVYISGDKHIYESYLSPTYQDDMFIRLLNRYDNYYLQIFGLKHWLDKNILSKQENESDR